MNRSGRSESWRPGTLLAACLLWGLATVAPVEGAMSLKLDGVEGDSQDARHEGEIDLLSWSWGVSVNIQEDQRRTSVVPAFKNVVFTKTADSATTALLDLCARGENVDRAVLTIRGSGEEAVEFYTVVLEDVKVSQFVVTGSSEEVPHEAVALSYARAGVEYIRITPKGEPDAPLRFSYDLQAGTEGGVTFPGEDPFPQEDADEDGLPDAWEAVYGFDPAVDEAQEDADGDGATNREEYIAGTHPKNPDEVLKAQLSEVTGGPIAQLTWAAVAGRQYRVLVSPSLDEPFQEHSVISSSETGPTSTSVPAGLVTGFFRIEVVADQ